MHRHVMTKHRNALLTTFQTVSMTSRKRLRFRFEHPFNYMIAGMTYAEMLVATPHIEFFKGIPTALEQDSYFDVNKRNLIAFDDQMIDASKDKRIVNLFIRDSHHRNLSVIYIVQNLFHQGKA